MKMRQMLHLVIALGTLWVPHIGYSTRFDRAREVPPLLEACQRVLSKRRGGVLDVGHRIQVGEGNERYIVSGYLGRGGSRVVYQMESIAEANRQYMVSGFERGHLGLEEIASDGNRDVLARGLARYYEVQREVLLGRTRGSPFLRMEILPVELRNHSELQDGNPRVASGVVGELGRPAKTAFVREIPIEQLTDEELHRRLILAEELSEAIAWLNTQGLEHLDIKLGNVVVLGEGEFTDQAFTSGRLIFALADQGLMREKGALFPENSTYGTPLTMGPEQATGGVAGAEGMAFSVAMTVLQTLLTNAEISALISGPSSFAATAIPAIRTEIEALFAPAFEGASRQRRYLLQELRGFLLERITRINTARPILPSWTSGWLSGRGARRRSMQADRNLEERIRSMRPLVSEQYPEVFR